MPRIAGVEIPNDKRMMTSLTYIYGIGPTIAGQVLKEAQIDPQTKGKDLTEDEVSRLAGVIAPGSGIKSRRSRRSESPHQGR